LPPGRYFRLLLSAISKAWMPSARLRGVPRIRFALREFLGLVLPGAPADHSTISRTPRLIDAETHQAHQHSEAAPDPLRN
jgi:hypothetical protein